VTADNADPQTLNVEDRTRNAKRIDWRYWLGRREVIVLVILVAGSVIFNFTHHSYLTSDNIVTILSNVAVVAIVSIGMTMVIVTGGIDVSVGSMLALCMLMSAKTMVAGGDLVVALAPWGTLSADRRQRLERLGLEDDLPQHLRHLQRVWVLPDVPADREPRASGLHHSPHLA
jgi:hypothetical protein